jgi:hypothetical protein
MHIWPDGILAPLLAVALFVFWGALGYAVLGACRIGFERGRQLLVAPSVGAAVCVMPIFWINWWGLPIRQFAWPLFGALVVLTTATVWWRPSGVQRRDVWPAALVLTAALLLNGWPLITHGFAWLSYTNDDMATYCLMANRLLNHGLVEPPSASVLAAGSDLSAHMWLFEVAFGRPGSHLMLAWAARLTGKSVVEVYMPVTIATHLALVAAAAAIVWRDPEQRRAAFATSWLMAASGLTALGTVSQLLPQVFGLAIACAFLALVWDIDRPTFGIGRAAIAAVVGASLLIVYTEFVPFVAIPWLARMCALGLWRRDRQRSRFMVASIVAGGLLCVAPYADRVSDFLVGQSVEGVSTIRSDLFPHLRLSTVFAIVWGWLPVARGAQEPYLSIAIVAGAVAFGALAIGVVRPVLRGEAAPAMCLFILIFGVFLFVRGHGFGLFKIAMYVQPFMLGTVALILAAPAAPARARTAWIAIALLVMLDLPTQAFYVRSSIDTNLGRAQIVDQRAAMRELLALGHARGRTVDVDLPVSPMAKLAAAFLDPVPLRFLGLRETFRPRGNPTMVAARYRQDVAALSGVVRQGIGTRHEFALHDPQHPSKSNRFYLVERPSGAAGPAPCEQLLTATPVQSVINRSSTAPAEGAFRLVPCQAISNHLAFVSSNLGRNYFYGNFDPIGLFALEPDYFFSGRTFAGVGRHLLFEILQPAGDVRLVLDFTASLKADGANRLPPMAVVGSERVSLGAVGRGSARLYSRPVPPQWIDGHAYVALDLGEDGTLYPDGRRGLMLWLGRDLVLDPRRLVGLARNISLVSDSEYARLEAPARIERFPGDLAEPALEFSGVYEDRWVAEDLFVRLKAPNGPGVLTLKGILLPTSSGSGMTITIDLDGAVAVSQHRDPGSFAIDVPVAGTRRDRIAVRVRFSEARPLSADDRRPVSALLEYLGVAPASH